LALYVVLALKGPRRRYSGRNEAVYALILGLFVFVGEGLLAARWLGERRQQQFRLIQETAPEDLRALLRAQRWLYASENRYGGLEDARFRPRYGRYTIYMGPEDVMAGQIDGEEVVEPLPEAQEPMPAVTPESFTAVAVSNLDDDATLDLWVLTADGEIVHLTDDAEN
jgi:hypothetical protein